MHASNFHSLMQETMANEYKNTMAEFFSEIVWKYGSLLLWFKAKEEWISLELLLQSCFIVKHTTFA